MSDEKDRGAETIIDFTGDDDFYSYVEWSVSRHGEHILWGTGVLYLDVPNFAAHGYEIHIEDDTVQWDEFPADAYVLTTPDGYPDPEPKEFRGFAVGDLNRKMIPEATPDITAVKMEPAEVFEDPHPGVDGEMKCSYFSCGKEAVVREAWYDDPDEVPSFVSGEVAYCSEHMQRFGDGFE